MGIELKKQHQRTAKAQIGDKGLCPNSGWTARHTAAIAAGVPAYLGSLIYHENSYRSGFGKPIEREKSRKPLEFRADTAKPVQKIIDFGTLMNC
jgi:hypothetical protein